MVLSVIAQYCLLAGFHFDGVGVDNCTTSATQELRCSGVKTIAHTSEAFAALKDQKCVELMGNTLGEAIQSASVFVSVLYSVHTFLYVN